MILEREVRALMGKEWRQLLRNRGALASALLLPTALLLVLPVGNILAVRREAALPLPTHVPAEPFLPAGLQGITVDPKLMVRALLPLVVSLGGLVVPAITATYTLISERETRSLELLAALPVRVGQILWAKLLVIVLVGGGASLALVGVDCVVMLATGFASVGYVVALVALLLCALAYSTGTALLTSLLARDLRTANNVNGALLMPTLMTSLGVLLLVPGEALRVWALAALFALGAVVAVVVAIRVVTFERLLS